TRLLRSGSAPVLEAVELGDPPADAENDLLPADVACPVPDSTGTPLDHDVERDEVHLLPLDERRRDGAVVAGVAIAGGRAWLRVGWGRTVIPFHLPEGECDGEQSEAGDCPCGND